MGENLLFVLIKEYFGDMNYTSIHGVFDNYKMAEESLIKLYNESIESYKHTDWLQSYTYDERTNTYKFYGDDADIIEIKLLAYTPNSYRHLM